MNQFAALDRPAGEREEECLLRRLDVRGVGLLVASHVGELVEGEFTGHDARRCLSGDVQYVVVLVVARPRPFVRVVSDVDADRPLEVVLGLEEVRRAEKRVRGGGPQYAHIHVYCYQVLLWYDSCASTTVIAVA